MVRRIYMNSQQYNTERDGKEAVLAAWEEADEHTITNLVHSMLCRILEVIVNAGGDNKF